MIEFIKIINKALGFKLLPETKYLLLKVFSADSDAIYHLKCVSCHKYGFKYQLNTQIQSIYYCFRCGHPNTIAKPKVIFVSFPLRSLLTSLVHTHENHLILHNKKQNIFPMEDVFNGNIYNNTLEKTRGSFLILGTNTDGVQRFKSSKDSLWPQYMTLYNIPAHLRMKQENIIISGLFSGKEIEMDYFYENIIKDIEEINERGGISTKAGNIPCFCLLASLDSTARPKLQKHMQFNGFHGCSFCFTKGESIEGSMKYPQR